MTKLLVSIRNATEAEAALAGGADIIDVKEPRRGALGPADPEVWQQIRAAVRGRAVTSVALGELLTDPVVDLAASATGFRFAKVGLAGCHTTRGWLDRWFAAVNALPASVHPVPVAYADWPAARAPSPSIALALAAQSPARLLLVDTYDKAGGNLLDVLSRETLCELLADARRSRVHVALAGSLDAAAIAELLPLAPAYVGVRGAACRGGRRGAIETARVKSLAQLVHSPRRLAAG
jgi:(5-formylfuran-3-yl)methyl phosphate synthase